MHDSALPNNAALISAHDFVQESLFYSLQFAG